ncbi:hypothetical protein [Planococcus versutus]|uniref:Uncharacterized protein n=1 Tax=Planococcus versutus TaxID=1302659 RepID=A0A1B1S3A5_9BACL|nr:hypothetical protein [Planococcus versutus]ANU27674.1 hypothetical protein I858_011820 [Planococcus versutus]
MEIIAEKDLLKDRYGNYYMVSHASKKALTIVNEAMYQALKETLDEELVAKVKANYLHDIACGKYFADLVHEQVEQMTNSENGGTIYDIEEVKKEYDLHIKPLYDDSFYL